MGSRVISLLVLVLVNVNVGVKALGGANVAGLQDQLELTSTHYEEFGPAIGMFFFVEMMLFGAFALHITCLGPFRTMHVGVLMFVFGLIYAIVHESSDDLKRWRGANYDSYMMWVNIDPELLMWALLPPVLMSYAINLDTGRAVQVWKQVLWLAGPFVVMQTFMLGPIVKLILRWDFKLCFAVSAIWVTTDPVAVNAVVRHVGLPPFLNTILRGESMLNDGVALLMFSIFSGHLSGTFIAKWDTVITLICLKTLSSFALGLIIGIGIRKWIKAVGHRYIQASEYVQLFLTIACSTGAWALCRGYFQGSGVICVVVAGFVVSDTIWPYVVRENNLRSTWNAIEYLSNGIIFFLVGAMSGHTIFRSGNGHWILWSRLWLLYFAVSFVRAACLFLSWPLLQLCSKGVKFITLKDVMVLQFGGLKGTVGICMALQLQGSFKIDDTDEDNAVLYSGGLACLTMIINGQLAPLLLRAVGALKESEFEDWMIKQSRQHLTQIGMEFSETLGNPKTVDLAKRVVNNALEQVKSPDAIVNQTREEDMAYEMAEQNSPSGRTERDSMNGSMDIACVVSMLRMADGIITNGYESAWKYWMRTEGELNFSCILDSKFENLSHELTIVLNKGVKSMDHRMMDHINSIFLTLLKAEYTQMIAEGEFERRHETSQQLLDSVDYAQFYTNEGLGDAKFLFDQNNIYEVRRDGLASDVWPQFSTQPYKRQEKRLGYESFADTIVFKAVAVICIIFNALWSTVWAGKFAQSTKDWEFYSWVAVHGTVCFIFIVEAFARVWSLMQCKRQVSKNYSIIFLISFIFLLWVEILFRILGESCEADCKEHIKRFSKLNRWLGVLRCIDIDSYVREIYRVVSKCKETEEQRSSEARYRVIDIFTACATAHVKAQATMLTFTGRTKDDYIPEVANTILQSMGVVVRALTVVRAEAQKVNSNHLNSLIAMKDACRVVTAIAQTIDQAADKQVINPREMEKLSLPLDRERDRLRYLIDCIYKNNFQEGDVKEVLKIRGSIADLSGSMGHAGVMPIMSMMPPAPQVNLGARGPPIMSASPLNSPPLHSRRSFMEEDQEHYHTNEVGDKAFETILEDDELSETCPTYQHALTDVLAEGVAKKQESVAKDSSSKERQPDALEKDFVIDMDEPKTGDSKEDDVANLGLDTVDIGAVAAMWKDISGDEEEEEDEKLTHVDMPIKNKEVQRVDTIQETTGM